MQYLISFIIECNIADDNETAILTIFLYASLLDLIPYLSCRVRNTILWETLIILQYLLIYHFSHLLDRNRQFSGPTSIASMLIWIHFVSFFKTPLGSIFLTFLLKIVLVRFLLGSKQI